MRRPRARQCRQATTHCATDDFAKLMKDSVARLEDAIVASLREEALLAERLSHLSALQHERERD